MISADDHPDLSRRLIDKQMGHLPPETRRQVTRDNAAALYGL
jgi:predicted TIM-barrel fold metal-dependent hydrolase